MSEEEGTETAAVGQAPAELAANPRESASLQADLARCEQLLRGRMMDIEQAKYREEAASARVQELTKQVEKFQKQMMEQRQEAGKMSAEVGKLRAEGSQSAQRGAREVARLKWELETERASVRELTENNQQFIAKVTALQERCSALEDARREVVSLRGKLAEMAKSRAEAMTIAASATAEAELLRVKVKEAEEKYLRTVRHAQGQEAEVQAEREALRRKMDELDKQQARLQDDLAAVKAAGVLSKSGTMRFEIGSGLLSSMPSSSNSRPSTAEGPDEQYRLSKQVRELQDRLRLQQGQLQECQAAVEEERQRATAEVRQAKAELIAENEALRRAAAQSEARCARAEAACAQTAPNADTTDSQSAATEGAEERPGSAPEMESQVHWLRAELSAARRSALREQQALLEELETERRERASANLRAENRGHEVVGLQVQLRDLNTELEQQRQTSDAWRIEGMREEIDSLTAALEEEGQRAEEALTHVGEQNRLITALQGKLRSLESAGVSEGRQEAWGRKTVAASSGTPYGGYASADAPRPHTAPWASTTVERGTSRGHAVDTVRQLRRTSNGSTDLIGGNSTYITGETRSHPLSPATRGKRIASAWSSLSTGGMSPHGQRAPLSGALRGSAPWRPQSSATSKSKKQSVTLF